MDAAFAKKYGDYVLWHWWFRGRERILASVLGRELPLGADRRILSIGSGPPEGLAWLLALAGKDGTVIAADRDPTGSLRSAGGVSAPLVIAGADAPPFAPRQFDVVLALDVIEHLDDDAGALAASAALVAPGGLFVVTVPAGPSLWGRQDVVSGHRRRYTKRSLRDAFSRAALAAPRVSYFNSFLYPPIALSRWTRRSTAGSDFDGSHPGLVNSALGALFRLERHFVGRVPFPFGVSLMALLRR